MTEAVGAVLIILAAGVLALSAYGSEKRATWKSRMLWEFAAYMKRRVEVDREPLSQIILDFSTTSDAAREALGETEAKELPHRLSELCPDISSEINKIFDTLFDSTEGASDACAELEHLCREKSEETAERFEKRKKAIVILPFVAAAMLIILLI